MTNEYVEKFSYRAYTGEIEPRWKRVWSLAWFELVSTWRKSTVGKVLLIIILAFNLLIITIGALVLSAEVANLEGAEKTEAIASVFHGLVGGYLSAGIGGDNRVSPSNSESVSFQMNLGFLVIGLFAIAGSGAFADDRQGKLMEVYLSRVQRWEYALGKVSAIIIYINLFCTVPLLIMGGLYIQAIGLDHLDYLYYYAGICLYGLLASLLIGLVILVLSSIVEKRMYASLAFYLLFILGSLFGTIVTQLEPSNEFLQLVSPSTFLELLAYICLGDFELWFQTAEFHGPHTDTEEEITFSYKLLSLNDGAGLEYFHVLGITFVLIAVMFAFLVVRLRMLTTEALS
jgi:ABC-type transport system involved in multi-copper enzyme maturation permease subunit